MINDNPWIRPFLYLALVVFVYGMFEVFSTDRNDLPVKEIYFSSMRKRPLVTKNDTSQIKTSINFSELNATTPERNRVDSTTLAGLASEFLNLKIHKTKNPVIRYYTKPMNGNSVFQLENYGFYVHERKTKNLTQFKSNVIHFGDSVSIDKIKIISFVLISSGLDIKEIAPSRYHAGWKYNSIEVGADTTLLKNPSITYTYLYNLK